MTDATPAKPKPGDAKAKGKGDLRPAAPPEKEDNEWKVRKADWNAPVLQYADVAAAVNHGSSAFLAVVYCKDTEIGPLGLLLKTSGVERGVLGVVLAKKASEGTRCPGECSKASAATRSRGQSLLD